MATATPDMGGPHYPAHLEVQPIEDMERWRPLVQWFLAIPHLIVVYGLSALRGVLQLIAFFTVLFTKEIPKEIFNVMVMTMRYQWRTYSYTLFLRQTYPPFDFTMSAEDDGIDQASLTVEYPGEMKRWMPLVKWLFAIPHYLVLMVLEIGAFFATLGAALMVLFTGKYPDSIRSYVVNVARWHMRVVAYAGLLRDEYPPFAFE
jgi:hypothetical protein